MLKTEQVETVVRKGLKHIYSAKEELWRDYVKYYLFHNDGQVKGNLQLTLDLIKVLDLDEFSEEAGNRAYQMILNSNWVKKSANPEAEIKKIEGKLINFAKCGPQAYLNYYGNKLDDKTKSYMENKVKENIIYAKRDKNG